MKWKSVHIARFAFVALLVVLIMPSANAHHSLQCISGLDPNFGQSLGGDNGSAYQSISRGISSSFDSSIFSAQGANAIDSASAPVAETFRGKTSQKPRIVAKLTSATRAPASAPPSRQNPPNPQQDPRIPPKRQKLPEPPEPNEGDGKEGELNHRLM